MLNGCAYILTVDVGNTFIRFGLFAEDSAAAQECPLATCEITTPSSITADEARMRLAQVMAALAADAGMPGALVPAAAVPLLTSHSASWVSQPSAGPPWFSLSSSLSR